MINLSNIQITEAEEFTEPVNLADVKDWISGLEDVADFDDMLTPMIVSARQDIENYLNLKLVDSTVSVFVSSTKEEDEVYQFPYAENVGFISNTSVSKIIRGEADEVLTENEHYWLNDALYFNTCGKYKVTYFIDASNVSDTIKEAIKMLVAYRFGNRGDQQSSDQQGMPEDVISKIHPYKQIWL